MSKEEQLLEYWQELTVDQQEEALKFLKTLSQKPVPEQISPLGKRLQEIRQRIVDSGTPLQESPSYQQSTPEEWSQAFTEWVEGHRSLNLPHLSDAAISRESLYGERYRSCTVFTLKER
jgi:hypothetical protein